MKDIRIVFMGTPSFAVPILEGLIDNYNVVMVVSQPDRKKNRKGEVIKPDTKLLAEKYGIPVFQPVRVKEEYQEILDMNPDMIVTCAYGQIIPEDVLKYPRYGCINVHGSLLPKLRGGAPIHHSIINGDKETGITVMSMDKRMDAGDIISQRSIKIEDDMILDELYSKMSYLGRDLLLDTMPSIIDGTATYTKQDEEYTKAINEQKQIQAEQLAIAEKKKAEADAARAEAQEKDSTGAAAADYYSGKYGEDIDSGLAEARKNNQDTIDGFYDANNVKARYRKRSRGHSKSELQEKDIDSLNKTIMKKKKKK